MELGGGSIGRIPLEVRMSVCHMSIEAGARFSLSCTAAVVGCFGYCHAPSCPIMSTGVYTHKRSGIKRNAKVIGMVRTADDMLTAVGKRILLLRIWLYIRS